VLDMRNASAQMRAAGALAVLSSRNVIYRNAIYEAGAIPPLVRQLGDGTRVENDTPQERAACVLADLARSSESKIDIVQADGVKPLVSMLSSASSKAQTAASVALSHLACTGDNKATIAKSGGIDSLVAVLAGSNRDAKRPATSALCQLTNTSENKAEIVNAGGIPLVVQVMNDDPQTQESAAQVLAELAKGQLPQKQEMVEAGGIESITLALKEGTPGAQRFAASALWGLASCGEFKRPIVDAGAVPHLVALLRNAGEAQGYAVAALSQLAETGEGKKNIFMSHGVEPLLDIASSAERAWLRSQAVDVLAYLNIKDPLAETGAISPQMSPRTPRAGALTARGSANMGGDDDGRRTFDAPGAELEAPRDPIATLIHVTTHKVMEVVAGSKPLQLRAGFDLATEKAGDLPPKKAVHILEERMTDDGKTRMCVSAEGSITPLGWVTGKAADNKSNLKEAGRAVMQVVAAKALVAREHFDLTSPKVKDLAAGAYVHVMEARPTSDGAQRIAFAMEGKDVVKGWVTAISKDGALNLDVAIAEARRTTPLAETASPEKEKAEKPEGKEDEDETPAAALSGGTPSKVRRGSFQSDVPWSTVVAPEDAMPPEPGALVPPTESPQATGRNKRASDAAELAVVMGAAKDTALSSAAPVGASMDSVSSTGRRKSISNAEPAAKEPVPTIAPPEPMPEASMATARRKSTQQTEQAPLATGRAEQTPSTARSEQPGTARRNSITSSPTPRATALSATPRATTATPRAASPLGTTPRTPVTAGATPRASPSKTASVAISQGEVLVATGKLKMRSGRELDSDEAGSLAPKTRVIVIERSELEDGTRRARVAREADGVPLGWVSSVAKDGRENLEAVGAAPASPAAGSSFAASTKVPSLGSSAAPFTALPPTSASSGALTARSTAKAAAAAGAAKAALPTEAVLAAELAAREAVASQTAAAVSARNARSPAGTSSAAVSPFRAMPPSTPGRAASPMTPGRATPRSGSKSARGSSPFGPR